MNKEWKMGLLAAAALATGGMALAAPAAAGAAGAAGGAGAAGAAGGLLGGAGATAGAGAAAGSGAGGLLATEAAGSAAATGAAAPGGLLSGAQTAGAYAKPISQGLMAANSAKSLLSSPSTPIQGAAPMQAGGGAQALQGLASQMDQMTAQRMQADEQARAQRRAQLRGGGYGRIA